MRESSFEYFFTTAWQDMYALMCYFKAYAKLHITVYYYVSSGVGRPLTDGSITDDLKSLYNTLNFIDIWLQMFDTNKAWRCILHKETIS